MDEDLRSFLLSPFPKRSNFPGALALLIHGSFICRGRSPHLKRAILFSEGGSFLAGFSPCFFHDLQKFKTVDGGTRIHAGVFLGVHRQTCLITRVRIRVRIR